MQTSETRFDMVLGRKLDLSEIEDKDRHNCLAFLKKDAQKALVEKCKDILQKRKRHLLLQNEKQAAVIYLYDSGYSVKYILTVVGTDMDEFNKVIRSVQEDMNLFMKKISVAVLSETDRKNIISLLRRSPRMARVNADSWTVQNVTVLLRDRYGVIPDTVDDVKALLLAASNGGTISGRIPSTKLNQEAPVQKADSPKSAEDTNSVKREEENMKSETPTKADIRRKDVKEKVTKYLNSSAKLSPAEKAACKSVLAVIEKKADASSTAPEGFFEKTGYPFVFARKITNRMSHEKVEDVLQSCAISSAKFTDLELKRQADALSKIDGLPKKIKKDIEMIHGAILGEKTFSELGKLCGFTPSTPFNRLKSIRKNGVAPALNLVYPGAFVQQDSSGEWDFSKAPKMNNPKGQPKTSKSAESSAKHKAVSPAKADAEKVAHNYDKVVKDFLDESRKAIRELPFSDKQISELKEIIAKVLPSVTKKSSEQRLKTFYLTLLGFPTTYAREILGINGKSTARSYTASMLKVFADGGWKKLVDCINSFSEGKPVKAEKPKAEQKKPEQKKAENPLVETNTVLKSKKGTTKSGNLANLEEGLRKSLAVSLGDGKEMKLDTGEEFVITVAMKSATLKISVTPN